MLTPETILIGVILIAGLYMAWNIGANDVANAMGTSVGSGALTLTAAVCLAAVLEFTGALTFGSYVTETIQKGILQPKLYSDYPYLLVYGMLASLVAAGMWLQIASYFGWPVSTTHSIVGAVVGFGIIVGGVEAIYWSEVAMIVSSWVISPLLGGMISFAIFSLLRRAIFFRSHPVNAAKRITPFFAFFFFFFLPLILFDRLSSDLEWRMILLIAIGMGLVGALICFIFVRRIKEEIGISTREAQYNPEIGYELERAKRRLKRVRDSTTGELHHNVEKIINQIRSLPFRIQTPSSSSVTQAYAKVEKIFGVLQIFTAALMAFAHGANDVANAIGPLAACFEILNKGDISPQGRIHLGILALGGVGIVAGLATWGWRVIETVGRKITDLTPTRGFSAEFGAALTILVASRLGLPISTTHTLVGAVIGVGLARGIEALDLRTTRSIVISWLVTVPAGAVLATIFFFIFNWFFTLLGVGA